MSLVLLWVLTYPLRGALGPLARLQRYAVPAGIASLAALLLTAD